VETILFLHGWGGNSDSFAPIVNYFSKYYKVLSPTMPSEAETQTVWTLDDYVNYIARILADNNIAKCHIIAHSFGARVAVLLARKHIVDKMVIVGGAGLKPRFNIITWTKIKLYKWLKIGHGSSDYQKLTAAGKKTFINIISRDLSPEIQNAAVPTLLITGASDTATPPYMAKRWAKLCKNAAYKIYKNCGHFAYLDNPVRFIKDTQKFLQNEQTLVQTPKADK
jgi:pimeloyl-ACP methyl ester carboxylesterase